MTDKRLGKVCVKENISENPTVIPLVLGNEKRKKLGKQIGHNICEVMPVNEVHDRGMRS